MRGEPGKARGGRVGGNRKVWLLHSTPRLRCNSTELHFNWITSSPPFAEPGGSEMEKRKRRNHNSSKTLEQKERGGVERQLYLIIAEIVVNFTVLLKSGRMELRGWERVTLGCDAKAWHSFAYNPVTAFRRQAVHLHSRTFPLPTANPIFLPQPSQRCEQGSFVPSPR